MSSTNYGPARTPSKRQCSPYETSPYKDEGASAEIMHLRASNAIMHAENANLKAQMDGMYGAMLKLDSQRKALIKRNNALGHENKKMEDQLLFAHIELVWAIREVSKLNRLAEAPAVEKECWDETAGVASVPSSAAGKSSDPRLMSLPASRTSRTTREITGAAAALVSLAHTDTERPVIASGAEVASMFEQAKKNAANANKGRAGKVDDKETEEEKRIAEKENKMAPGDPRRTKRQKTSHSPEGRYRVGYI